MNKNDLSFFRCLSCKSDLSLKVFEINEGDKDNVKEGVLFCPSCKILYPISESIALLLDVDYCKHFDTRKFFQKWSKEFDFDKYKPLRKETSSEKFKQLDFYNEDSKSYDDLVSYSNFWKASDWNILQEWSAGLPKDGVILDVGCGTGRCAVPLVKGGKRVIATDLSIGMLRKAVAKSAEAGVNNITYFLADAESLPLKPDLFSAIISFGLLHHVNNPVTIIKSTEKLLKAGGIFCALENNASPLRPIFEMLMKIWKLWNEEAGSHPVFKLKEMKAFIENSGMSPKIRTSTFLPPHLCNLMSYNMARKMLFLTDWIFNRIPVVSNFGGQLVVRAVKTKKIPRA
ncbi:MAG: methyltransferase domain-containing protein [Candidatus Aureabacteria bacterium]|nr:methyltransferase domain-containing protein [Candidatus Auribacterota bacterium]